MLTFENSPLQGAAAIVEKLVVSPSLRIFDLVRQKSSASSKASDYTAGNRCANSIRTSQSLPFQKVRHDFSTLDAQPSNESGGILVMVTGTLSASFQLDGEVSSRS